MYYEFKEIRNITTRLKSKDPRYGFRYFIMSDLSWLRYQNSIQFLKDFIPAKSKVLEIGCGLGHTTAMLAILRRDVEIIGTDILEAPTWKYFTKFGCTFRQCDATNMCFNNEEFDFVISFGVIEHIQESAKALKEIYRCLKHGGYNIIFDLPNKYSWTELSAMMLGVIPHNKKYLLPEIIKLFNTHGFKIIDIKRQHIMPAHIHRVNYYLGEFYNMFCKLIFKLDNLICKTNFAVFSQDYMVVSKKL